MDGTTRRSGPNIWVSYHCSASERLQVVLSSVFLAFPIAAYRGLLDESIDSAAEGHALIAHFSWCALIYLTLTFIPFVAYKYLAVTEDEVHIGCRLYRWRIPLRWLASVGSFESNILFHFDLPILRFCGFFFVCDRPAFEGFVQEVRWRMENIRRADFPNMLD